MISLQVITGDFIHAYVVVCEIYVMELELFAWKEEKLWYELFPFRLYCAWKMLKIFTIVPIRNAVLISFIMRISNKTEFIAALSVAHCEHK